jgi:hypothetical protein
MSILHNVDGTEEVITVDNENHAVEVLGGLVEIVESHTNYMLLVNEEAYMMGLPPNKSFPHLYGPVIRVNPSYHY